MFKEESGSIILFTTIYNLQILVGPKYWIMDGSFKMVPTFFKQLYTIHGHKQNTIVPLVYALLTSKHQKMYELLLQKIINAFGTRTEFSLWIFDNAANDHDFVQHIMFTDEYIFHTNSMICYQNYWMWAENNPHWVQGSNNQYRTAVMVCCGIYNRRVIGPYFFEKTVSNVFEVFGNIYPLLWKINTDAEVSFSTWHYTSTLRYRSSKLNTLKNKWIGRGGPVQFKSSDLTSCDFFLWRYFKEQVFQIPVDR